MRSNGGSLYEFIYSKLVLQFANETVNPDLSDCNFRWWTRTKAWFFCVEQFLFLSVAPKKCEPKHYKSDSISDGAVTKWNVTTKWKRKQKQKCSKRHEKRPLQNPYSKFKLNFCLRHRRNYTCTKIHLSTQCLRHSLIRSGARSFLLYHILW